MMERKKAQAWLEQASADYVAGSESSDPYTICFHAQQWVEKATKAVISLHGVQVPRTHDMEALLSTCEQLEPSLADISRHAALLQPFAVAVRYDPCTKEQAVRECAVVWRAAREICEAIQKVIESAGSG